MEITKEDFASYVNTIKSDFMDVGNIALFCDVSGLEVGKIKHIRKYFNEYQTMFKGDKHE